jgi:hypothetical protein
MVEDYSKLHASIGEKLGQVMDKVITMLKMQQIHDEKLRKSKSQPPMEDEDDDDDDEEDHN